MGRRWTRFVIVCASITFFSQAAVVTAKAPPTPTPAPSSPTAPPTVTAAPSVTGGPSPSPLASPTQALPPPSPRATLSPRPIAAKGKASGPQPPTTSAPIVSAQQVHASFQPGDVFVGGDGGKVEWHLPDGTLNSILDTGASGSETGAEFGVDGNLYVPAFQASNLYRFNSSGTLLGSWGCCYTSDPEGVLFNAAGQAYVGLADGNRNLLKFDPLGSLVATYTPATQNRGIDWFDLASDQCTLRYTSEGTLIKQFNVCTNQQLPDWGSLPGSPHVAFKLRLIDDNDVLVADWIDIRWLRADGSTVRVFDAPGEDAWFALDLDPDGTSFWAVDYNTAKVYHFDLASGQVLSTFQATGGEGDDIAIYRGPRGVPAEQTYGTGSGLHGNDPSRLEAEPVNTAIGNYVHQDTDLTLPGRGLSLAFSRSYNSLSTGSGPLGVGWTHSYAVHLTLNPDASARLFAEDGAQLFFAPDGSGGFLRPSGAYSSLIKLGDGSYQLTRRDQVVYHFDSTGTLLSETDRNGNHLTFAYTSGRLTTITDTVGRTVTLGYDGSGRLTSLSAPLSRTVTYAYDGSGRLASVTDLAGKTTTYGYDTSNRLTTITDANSHVVVTNEYGTDGRVSAQTDALGHRSTFAWNATTQTATYTDPAGKAWTDVYANNVLQRHSDPLGHTSSYGYDPNFNRTAVTDPNGHTTAYTFDANSNMLTRTAPAPLSYGETWTYTARNDVATYQDGRGNTTTYGYDAAGNQTSMTQPGSVVTSYGRDPAGTGLLVSTTDARGKTTSYTYDASANLASVTSPLGNKTTYGYDAAGRRTSSVDPRGNAPGGNPATYTTTYGYDAANRLTSVTDPVGHATTTVYDAVGNRTRLTDPNTHATNWAYDADNRLTSVTDALNHATSYTYDLVGNLMSRNDPNTHVTTYGYDAARRLTSVSDPLTHATTFGYNPAGNLTTRTDANGQLTTYTFDALNRITGIDYTDPATPDVTFAYDANGNRTTMTDGAGSETYTYDALNRLTGDIRGADAFSYGYDAASNVTSHTYPDGTVVGATYSNDERLGTVSVGSATTSYTYDPAGELTASSLPNGVAESRTYDPAGRITTIHAASASKTLTDLTYTYDPAGNPTAVTSAAAGAASTIRASTDSSGVQGNGTSTSAAMSADGRWVAFTSAASNLVAGDTNAATDVFVRDRLTGAVERVSVSSTGAQANGASELPTISADGRFVAFRSLASNLVSGDTNNAWDIFVHDRATGVTERVSVSSSGGQGTGTNRDPALSADGRYVAFASTSANLVSGDTNGAQDIFVHDRLSGATTRVSVDSSGVQGNADSYNPFLSADGHLVGFDSTSTNLVSGDTNAARDVFIRDRTANTTSRISVSSSGSQSNGASARAHMSASGSLVVFESGATNLVSGDTNAATDIFLRDRSANTTTRIDLRSGGVQTSRDSDFPTISADGRYVAYYSTDTGLVTGDTNGVGDVFELDRNSGTTSRVSVDSSGVQGNANSTTPALADNGSVAFESDASNLVSGDTNAATDLFVHGALAATTSYGYDAVNRLTQACLDPACAASLGYTYDPVGNRLSEARPDGTTTSAYNAAGQLTTVTDPAGGVTTYTFDAAGRQTAAGTSTFGYDAADRLTSATIGGVSHTYSYAGDGRRATGVDAGVTTSFVWDELGSLPQLAIERNGSGATLRRYTYGLGLTPLSLTAGSATSYLSSDALGSVLALSSSTGGVQRTATYQPFGSTLTAGQLDPAAPADPMAFAGQYLDPTGLYHLRARQYDPGTGRFLTTDPVAAAVGDPYVASYVYGRNSPARFTDPNGQCAILCGLVVGAIVGGVVSAVTYTVSTVASGGNLTIGGFVGHTLVGAAAGAVIGATLGLASGAALPAFETTALQATGGYVGGTTSLAGSRLIGDRITPEGAALQMGLSVAGAWIAPEFASGSGILDNLSPRALFGSASGALSTGFGIGAGLVGTDVSLWSTAYAAAGGWSK
jgi:RHS repeat-associated protein